MLLLESVEDGVRMVPLSHYLSDYENTGSSITAGFFSDDKRLVRYGTINRRWQSRRYAEQKYDKDEITKIIARITIGLGKHGDNGAYICPNSLTSAFAKSVLSSHAIPKDSSSRTYRGGCQC